MTELVDRLRAFSRRYDPRDMERRMMLEAADRLEEMERALVLLPHQPPSKGEDGEVKLTPEMVERAMGGARLFPWQRKKLMEGLRG